MKIVTLCAYGLGTCFALKVKIEEVLEKLGVSCEIVPSDLSNGFLEEADLYILPYGLNVDAEVPRNSSVLVVEDILDTGEIEEKLTAYLKEKR